MKKKTVAIFVIFVGFICLLPGYKNSLEMIANYTPSMVMVIDAGHGGRDSGAVAKDGTEEKSINLEIAKALAKEAESYKVNVAMTRENDDGLYDESNTTKGTWTKIGDMKARKKIIDEARADLVVSIHLNSFFSDNKVHGAQVFYPTNCEIEYKEFNEKLAENARKELTKTINDGTNRIILPKNDMYIFRDGKHNGLLVECGFLSNEGDLKRLKDKKYQKKYAKAIMKAIARTYDIKKEQNKGK